MILNARAESDQYLATAQAEIDQLKETLRIVAASGQAGVDTFMIEHFADLITPFADTMAAFPVDSLSVISGAEGSHEPIGPFHPHALALGKMICWLMQSLRRRVGRPPGPFRCPPLCQEVSRPLLQIRILRGKRAYLYKRISTAGHRPRRFLCPRGIPA
jgi:hypothetical protein